MFHSIIYFNQDGEAHAFTCKLPNLTSQRAEFTDIPMVPSVTIRNNN